MRSLLYAGAAAVAAFGMSGAAQAAEIWTNIDLQPAGSILTSQFGVSGIEGPGAFTHTFNFSLSDAATASGSVITIELNGAGIITFSAADLDGTGFTFNSFPGGQMGILGVTSLGAGAHAITVSGSGSGSYSGTLNVAAVPEPATWAMMIAGIGIVGFAMRRRADRVAVSFS